MSDTPRHPTETGDAKDGMKRREALKVIATAAALPVLGAPSEAGAQGQGAAAARPAQGQQGRQPAPGVPRGDAWDPDLIRPKKDWPRLLTAAEMTTLAALADTIIPADAKSPSATAVGAHQYINEHVSAPGENYARDLVRVRGGVS